MLVKINQSEVLKSEVKLNPNLRHHHSVTKTDKGKGKNIFKNPPLCRHSALHPEINFFEPGSRRASKSPCSNVPDGMKTLSVSTYVRRFVRASSTPRAYKLPLQFLLMIEIANTDPSQYPVHSQQMAGLSSSILQQGILPSST